MIPTTITFDSVSKAFEEPVLTDVSFSVKPGSICGLVGANGAGKSTLMRVLAGLVQADSGTALVNGQRYVTLDQPSTVIGIDLGSPMTGPSDTSKRHLRRLARFLGQPVARADELLELVGLSQEADKRIGAYSLGMTKRLALATALVARPSALVLDEPTNGLDPHGVLWLEKMLQDFAADGGTVLVSTHQLRDLAQIADDVIMLDKTARRIDPDTVEADFFAAPLEQTAVAS